MDENTSETLLNRYQSQADSAAAMEIFKRYESRIVALAQKNLLDVLNSKIDAQDISQETFASFFALADRDEIRWKRRGDLWHLLAGIAINKVKQASAHFAQQKRHAKRETQLQHLSDLAITTDSVRVLEELVEEYLTNEKPLFRAVLMLRLAGYSSAEIATRTQRSPRTIRRLLERLKNKILFQQTEIYDSNKSPARVSELSHATLDYHDFLLLKMIGEGSFSKVYLAKHTPTQNYVAVKVIRKKWLNDQRVGQLFDSEVQLLAKLDDPNIVRTFGAGNLPNGGRFIVLEWIEGRPLSQFDTLAVDSIGKTPDQINNQIKHWCDQITSAIDRLHAKQMAHGDLTPKNILVDSKEQIKIIDFGLSCWATVDLDNARTKDRRAVAEICLGLSKSIQPN